MVPVPHGLAIGISWHQLVSVMLVLLHAPKGKRDHVIPLDGIRHLICVGK